MFLDTYVRYRKLGRELNNKMIDSCLTKEILNEAGKSLGMLKDNTFIFDDEDESHILMDFALYECKSGNKNAIKNYIEKIGGKNEEEKILLSGLENSYTSLFEVSDINPEKFSLILMDKLIKKENIVLIDRGFSLTGKKEMLIFARVIPIENFFMTSGAAFAFNPQHEKTLLKEFESIKKSSQSSALDKENFITAFKLSKIFGIDITFM